MLEVDGGVNDATIGRCAEAGAHLMVVGSAIFNHSDYAARVATLTRLATTPREDSLNTMVRIVLIHPGSTDYDEQGRIQGTLDIPLNEQGTQEVKRMIDDLRSLEIAAVYCGPCQAAVETATAISEALGAKLKAARYACRISTRACGRGC